MTRWVVVALACAACRERSAVDDSAEAEGHYLAATTAYVQGHFAQAHEHFEAVKRLRPADPRLPAAEGELLYAEGRVPDAVAAFERATSVDPARATNWSRLAQLRVVTSDFGGARRAAAAALERNPQDFNALEVMADAARASGDLDAAVSTWLRASGVAPEPSRSALVMKAVAALVKAERGSEVVAVLSAAVDGGAAGTDVLSELGNRLVEATRFAEAVPIFAEAARRDATDPTLWELVGELSVRQGDLGAAEAAFRESLKVKNRSVVHVALARLCLSRDAGCVQQELDAALETAAGDEAREALELAELLERVGRGRDALVLLAASSEEPEQRANVALQRRVIALARQVSDAKIGAAACERLRRADGGVCRR
ncbi:MAG: tetratricopeptide repeat protein [Archangium sp.]|nr:tetratricopeptide repeat protein [Archangium sp.]